MIKRVSPDGASFALAIGAGLASALLFSLARQATFVAIALAYLSPLPLMIAAIGFGRAAGVAAGLTAAFTVAAVAFAQQHAGALVHASIAGLVFAAALAAPSLWLSLLATDDARRDAPGADGAPAPPSQPLERVLLSAVAIAAALGLVAVLAAVVRFGGLAAALDHADATLTPVLEGVAAEAPLPQSLDLHRMARLMALAAAPAVAASTLLMLVANLWLAARVADVSSLLRRPWADIPRELRLPRLCVPLFAVSVGAAFFGALPGLIGAIVAATLGVGFALVGLATTHKLSRGMKYRAAFLAVIYFGLAIVAPPWLLVAFAALGLAETLFSLRARKRRTSSLKP